MFPFSSTQQNCSQIYTRIAYPSTCQYKTDKAVSGLKLCLHLTMTQHKTSGFCRNRMKLFIRLCLGIKLQSLFRNII